MSLIYWDTNLFVYLMEYGPEYGPRIEQIRTRMRARRDTLCTSIFTLGELLVSCYKRNSRELAVEIRTAMQAPTVQVLPFTPEVADMYARIRAKHRVTSPDAIHLATAAIARTNLFLTNDQKLLNLTIPGIDFIAGLDVNLF